VTIVASSYNVAYYHYASIPATVSEFACVVGNPMPGDFLTNDTNSNWIVDPSPSVDNTMGQVWKVFDSMGRGLLDRVMSAYSPALGTSGTGLLPGTDGQADQTAGTATGGVPSNVHYTGGANLIARVNMFNR